MAWSQTYCKKLNKICRCFTLLYGFGDSGNQRIEYIAAVIKRNPLTPAMALQKAKHYCAWQERSHTAVKEKLYGFGLRKTDVEVILTTLIEENYLNEERFARLFAGGKFRQKKWGRVKIVYELKLQKVSSYNINKALEEIDEDVYQKCLLALAKKKWTSIANNLPLVKKARTTSYLLQKGYEPALIQQVIVQINAKQKA